jgi:ABC-2 type transport system ATP-binding protein
MSVTVRREGGDVLEVDGRTSEEIGELAAREGLVLWELTPQGASLEDAYLALTGDSVQHRAGQERGTAA